MLEIYDMTIVPIIIGLVQIFKIAGLKANYAPLVAVTLGVIFGIVYFQNGLKEGILLGLIFGLSASGLYSGSKNLTQKNDDA